MFSLQFKREAIYSISQKSKFLPRPPFPFSTLFFQNRTALLRCGISRSVDFIVISKGVKASRNASYAQIYKTHSAYRCFTIIDWNARAIDERMALRRIVSIYNSIVLQCLRTRAEDWWVGIPADHSYTRRPYDTHAYNTRACAGHIYILPPGRYTHITRVRMCLCYLIRRYVCAYRLNYSSFFVDFA